MANKVHLVSLSSSSGTSALPHLKPPGLSTRKPSCSCSRCYPNSQATLYIVLSPVHEEATQAGKSHTCLATAPLPNCSASTPRDDSSTSEVSGAVTVYDNLMSLSPSIYRSRRAQRRRSLNQLLWQCGMKTLSWSPESLRPGLPAHDGHVEQLAQSGGEREANALQCSPHYNSRLLAFAAINASHEPCNSVMCSPV